MRRSAVRIITLVALSVGAAAPAAAQWLPPYVAEGMAQQLAGRFGSLGEVTDPEGLVESARDLVTAMRGTIEAWGVEGTLDRAPRFERFTVPSSGNRYLDAMGGYSVCSLLLLRQLESPAFAENKNARFTSVLGLSSLTLAMIRLREPFVAAGGTDPEMEAYLAGADLEPVFAAIQEDEELLADAEAHCTPVVVASLEAALRLLSGDDDPSE